MIGRMVFILVHFSYVVIDALAIFTGTFLACWLNQEKFPLSIQQLLLDADNPFYQVFLAWFVTVLFFNGLFRLYQTRREMMESYEILAVIRSMACAGLTLLAFIYSMKIVDFPRSVFFLMIALTTGLLCLWRVFKRYFIAFLAAHGHNNFNVLIIGAGRVGVALAAEIARRPGLGFRIVGFLDDGKAAVDLKGGEILGTLQDLRSVISRKFVSKIFVTIHPGGNAFQSILEAAKEHKVAIRVVPEAFDQATGEILKYNIGLIPILEYCDLGHNRQQLGKRAFDLFLGSLTLVVLAPALLFIALLIRLDSPGPAFYFSRRYGRNGKIFKMWKFRSMVVDADERLSALKAKNEVDGPIFKIRQDPRVTRIGRFLRKYSLDELPQLINVLLGDMSLVGPRPLPIDQVQQEDLAQIKRLEVRPGITGLWQVRGRSDLSFQQLVKWDAWYIDNWSFILDLTILLDTIPVVLKGKGAY